MAIRKRTQGFILNVGTCLWLQYMTIFKTLSIRHKRLIGLNIVKLRLYISP